MLPQIGRWRSSLVWLLAPCRRWSDSEFDYLRWSTAGGRSLCMAGGSLSQLENEYIGRYLIIGG